MTAVQRPPSEHDIAQLSQAWQLWNSGNQAGAVDLVRPSADEGKLWALAMIIWFMHQQGAPGWQAAVPYAEKAIDSGYPFAVNYLIGNMINDAGLRPDAVRLLQKAHAVGLQIDPLGYAQALLTQGDAASTVSLLSSLLPAAPWGEDHWKHLIATASDSTEGIVRHAQEVAQRKAEFETSVSTTLQEIADHESRVDTEASQLITLVRSTSNRQAQSYFDEEAEQSGGEATTLWYVGLGVFVVAAIIAVLPVLLHYLGRGPKLGGTGLLSAHIAAGAAFGALAGILLSRSVRDRTKQRARDLSVALGTMFVYANQIVDEGERQTFLREMGRAVIEAHLSRDSGTSGGDELSGLVGLLRGGR